MERVVGIEPTLLAWKARVLPIYDTRLYSLSYIIYKWSGKRDSNSQPPPWQGGTLPLSHFRSFGADEESRTLTPLGARS